MLVNEDLALPAIVPPAEQRWVPSPQGGVERIMLDRIGGEVARATSLVRYAPGSAFAPHRHPGGEEILVLSGVFSDERGDYPAGWYLRNPPGSSHRPRSEPGALIFVKLFQMSQAEDAVVRVDTGDARSWTTMAGRRVCPLFEDADETVTIEDLDDGAALPGGQAGGLEMLVLAGGIALQGRHVPAGSWLRLPPGHELEGARALGSARVWMKTGHLAKPPVWPVMQGG